MSQASRRRLRKQAHEKAENQRMISLLEGKTEVSKASKAKVTTKESKDAESKEVAPVPAKEGKEVKETKSQPAKGGKGGASSGDAGTDTGSNRPRAPRWHEITAEYGDWVDEFARLRYIFDASGRHEAVYNEYGYDSIIPELDHREIRYHERINLYAAKKCYARREEYLKALAALPEVTSVQRMMYDAASEAWPDEAGLRYAQLISNSLVQEMNAFLLYAMNVNRNAPKTGGFSFFHPQTGATVYAWRDGTKQVFVEMKTGGDDQKVITDRKQIFKFMGDNTKLMHELFYGRTRREILSMLISFMCDGWVVVPNCCERV